MPYPIATLQGNSVKATISFTPSADQTAGTGFTAPTGDFVIPPRDMFAGVLGDAHSEGVFRCRKQNASDAFSIGALLDFGANGVIAGSQPLRVERASASGESFVFARLANDDDGGATGDGITETVGLLSVTDTTTNRIESDRHKVDQGVMIGAEFRLVSGVWQFYTQTRETVLLDSQAADYPLSAADIATITSKLSVGQAYWFDASDRANGVLESVEVRQSGVVTIHPNDGAAASNVEAVNPAEVINLAGITGSTVVLDAQNGKQKLFEMQGQTLAQVITFSVANLPDQHDIIIDFLSNQPNALPVFSGIDRYLSPTPIPFTGPTTISIANLNGRLQLAYRTAQ